MLPSPLVRSLSLLGSVRKRGISHCLHFIDRELKQCKCIRYEDDVLFERLLTYVDTFLAASIVNRLPKGRGAFFYLLHEMAIDDDSTEVGTELLNVFRRHLGNVIGLERSGRIQFSPCLMNSI